MKKILLALLLFSSILGISSAQETTWVNPFDTMNLAVPRSMISVVSNGVFYDEIDVLLLSPAELSNYKGITMYTAYGNYESWNRYPSANAAGPVGRVNPFSTNNLGGFFAEDDSFLDAVAFQLGYLLPVMGYRSGIVGGFEFFKMGNLTGYTVGNSSYYEEKTDNTEDGGAGTSSGVAEYETSEDYKYTDFTRDNSIRLGAGTDIGIVGVSLYANFESEKQTTGGTYDYSWSQGADSGYATPADITTSKNIKYGYKDGEATKDPAGDGSWAIAALGELPLVIKGISMPLTASLNLASDSSGTPTYGIPQKVSISETNVTGAANANNVSTLSYTAGVTDLDSATISGEHLAAASTANAQWADASAATGNAYANDIGNYNEKDRTIGVNGHIQPVIPLNNVLKARTSAGLGFSIQSANNDQAGKRRVDFSEATDSGTNSTFSYSETIKTPQKTRTTTISMELGGMLEASDPSGFLTVASGVFYTPVFSLATTTKDDAVTDITVSATDNSTAPVANADVTVTTPGQIGLGAGDFQGSLNQTSTTSYTGKDKSNTITHQFIIPVTTRVNLVRNKLSLIGGYVINGNIVKTHTETAGSSTETTTTTHDPSGTQVYPASGAVPSIDKTTTDVVSAAYASADWSGFMNFMLRWMPKDGLTVDFFGQSIMTALDMDLFNGAGGGGTGNDGFNLNYFINSLGMSITYTF